MQISKALVSILFIGTVLSLFSNGQNGNKDKEKVIKELVESISSYRTVEELVKIGKDAIPYLKPLLKSDDTEKKFWSAYTLAMLKDDSGIDIVTDGLKSEDEDIKIYSAGVLYIRDMASQDAIDILILKRAKEGLSMTALGFLTKQLTEVDIPAYIKGLGSNDEAVRKVSISFLRMDLEEFPKL